MQHGFPEYHCSSDKLARNLLERYTDHRWIMKDKLRPQKEERRNWKGWRKICKHFFHECYISTGIGSEGQLSPFLLVSLWHRHLTLPPGLERLFELDEPEGRPRTAQLGVLKDYLEKMLSTQVQLFAQVSLWTSAKSSSFCKYDGWRQKVCNWQEAHLGTLP